jgi:hypothetical protein
MTSLQDMLRSPELAKEIQRSSLKDSIVGQVADVRLMKFPEMTLTASLRNKTTDKIYTNSRVLEAHNYLTKTSFTQEALEDLYRIYGEDLKDHLLYYIKDEQTKDLDADFIDFCKANATISTPMSFNPASWKDFEQVHMNMFTKLNKERVRVCLDSGCPVRTFTIVSPNIGVSILSRIPSVPVEKQGLSHIASMGNNDIYMDTNHTDFSELDYVIVGVKGNGVTGSSNVLGSYASLMYEAVDPNSGENVLWYSNRTGFQLTPQDECDVNTNSSKWMRMYTVDLRGFENV